MTKNAYILILGLLLTACSLGRHKELDRIEEVMSSSPDSAVTLLRAMPADEWGWGHARARHALLLTIAQDRAYIEAEDDSLARIAYDYYNRYGSRRSKMLASYYLATIKANAGETVEATFLYMEAEKRAQKLQNYHIMGFAQQRLASLYSENYDHQEAQEYNLKAVRSFTLSGDTLSADLSRIDAAMQFRIMGKFDEAESILDSLLQQDTLNRFVQCDASAVKGDICFAREKWEQAEEYYAIVEKFGFDPTLRMTGNRAIIQEQLGSPQMADSLLDALRNSMRSEIDSTIFYSCAKKLFLLRGDFKNAYEALEMSNNYQDKSVSVVLARSATHAEKAFFKANYYLEKERKRNLALVATLLIIALFSAVILVIRAALRRKKEVEREREVVNEMRKDLLFFQEEQRASGVMLDSLLQDKINKIQKLSGAFFNWTDEAVILRELQEGKAMKEELLAQFRSELRALKEDPHLFSDVEASLNRSRGNLMENLRTAASQSPGVSFNDLDYKLLTLFFANFSSKSISFLLDMKDDAVRKRKSRYRKLFRSQGEAFSGFLKYLI